MKYFIKNKIKFYFFESEFSVSLKHQKCNYRIHDQGKKDIMGTQNKYGTRFG